MSVWTLFLLPPGLYLLKSFLSLYIVITEPLTPGSSGDQFPFSCLCVVYFSFYWYEQDWRLNVLKMYLTVSCLGIIMMFNFSFNYFLEGNNVTNWSIKSCHTMLAVDFSYKKKTCTNIDTATFSEKIPYRPKSACRRYLNNMAGPEKCNPN